GDVPGQPRGRHVRRRQARLLRAGQRGRAQHAPRQLRELTPVRGAAALALALVVAAPALAERIRDFDVELTVRADGTLGVEEHIRWDFEGASRHGIFRELPIAYERPGGP